MPADLVPSGIRPPHEPTAELVTVHIARECRPGATEHKDVFALYTAEDEAAPPSLARWRSPSLKPADTGRLVMPQRAVILDEPDICAGVAAPRVVLLGRDVTHLVMSAIAFERRAALRAQALAKLTPEEREALEVRDDD